MLRYGWILTVLLLIGWGGYSLYHHIYFRYLLTDLVLPYPLEKTWKASPLPHNFEKIIAQKFTYLGQGAQSYAFVSEDGLYVLKIFHYKNYAKPEKKGRLIANLEGYHLANTYIPRESGIVYQQLSPATAPSLQVKVTDRLGFAHTVDLSSVRYLLQKRTRPPTQDPNDIQRLMDLVYHERSLGLYDRDKGLVHNAGFIGDQAIHYDVGKLTYDPEFCQSPAFDQYAQEVKARLIKGR